MGRSACARPVSRAVSIPRWRVDPPCRALLNRGIGFLVTVSGSPLTTYLSRETVRLVTPPVRRIAAAALLLASLTVQASQGVVVAHLAIDHGDPPHSHQHDSADAHHHHAEHPPDHTSDVPGTEHTHEIAGLTTAAVGRMTDGSGGTELCFAPVARVRPLHLDRLSVDAPYRPSWRAGPPTLGRHSILLL